MSINKPDKLIQMFCKEHDTTPSGIVADAEMHDAIIAYSHIKGNSRMKGAVNDLLAHYCNRERRGFVDNFLSKHSIVKHDWMKHVAAVNWELAQVAMEHFAWQVKRKMAGLKVSWHMMPVLFGKQEGGKTTLIERMLSAIPAAYHTTGRINELGDERALRGFANSYVCFFDELEGAKRADIETLKSFITKSFVHFRPLSTNSRAGVNQSSTLIGASNHDLTEMIKDETGMRRFFQIECKDRLDWEALADVDWGDWWASIDEAGFSPLEAVMGQVKAAQFALVRDPLAEFIQDGIEDRTTWGGDEGLQSSVLYKQYHGFCLQNGFKHIMTNKKFTQDLVSIHGWSRRRTKMGAQLCPPPVLDVEVGVRTFLDPSPVSMALECAVNKKVYGVGIKVNSNQCDVSTGEDHTHSTNVEKPASESRRTGWRIEKTSLHQPDLEAIIGHIEVEDEETSPGFDWV